MIELLDRPDLLKDPLLKLDGKSVAGVPFGGLAEDVPAKLPLTGAQSKIAKSSKWTRAEGSKYFDDDGEVIPFDAVVRSVVLDGGTFNCDKGIGVHVSAGQVVGFAIYRDYLQVFSHIRDHDHFLREFGNPDTSVTLEAYGDLMGYEHHYSAAKKVVRWNSDDNKISIIVLGRIANAAA